MTIILQIITLPTVRKQTSIVPLVEEGFAFIVTLPETLPAQTREQLAEDWGHFADLVGARACMIVDDTVPVIHIPSVSVPGPCTSYLDVSSLSYADVSPLDPVIGEPYIRRCDLLEGHAGRHIHDSDNTAGVTTWGDQVLWTPKPE